MPASSSSPSQPGVGSGVPTVLTPLFYPPARGRTLLRPGSTRTGRIGDMRIDDAASVRLGPEDASSLLLLLHGRGADEHDLVPLAEALRLPDRVVALRGPVPWEGGRAWAE